MSIINVSDFAEFSTTIQQLVKFIQLAVDKQFIVVATTFREVGKDAYECIVELDVEEREDPLEIHITMPVDEVSEPTEQGGYKYVLREGDWKMDRKILNIQLIDPLEHEHLEFNQETNVYMGNAQRGLALSCFVSSNQETIAKMAEG